MWQHFQASERAAIEMNLAPINSETGDRDFRKGHHMRAFTLENLRTHRYVHLAGGAKAGAEPRFGPRHCCIVADLDDLASVDDLDGLCIDGIPPNLVGFRTKGDPAHIGRAQAIWLIDPVRVWVGYGTDTPQPNFRAMRYFKAVRDVLTGLLGDVAFSHHQSRSPWYSGEDAEYTWHFLHPDIYRLDDLRRGLERYTEDSFTSLTKRYTPQSAPSTPPRASPDISDDEALKQLELQLAEPSWTPGENEEKAKAPRKRSWTVGRVDSRGVTGRFRPFVHQDDVLQRNTWIMEALAEKMRSAYRQTQEVPAVDFALSIARECNEVLGQQDKGALDDDEVIAIAKSIHRNFEPAKISGRGGTGSLYTPRQRAKGGRQATKAHPEIFEKGRQKGRAAKAAADVVRATEIEGSIRQLLEDGRSVAQMVEITGLSRTTVRKYRAKILEP